MTTSSARVAGIDALRIAAVGGVVAAHWTWSSAWVRDHLGTGPEEAFGGLTMVSRYGFLGVQLFFTISGAVIARTVQGRTVGQFVTARVARIAPAFWLAVCLAACLHAVDGDRPPLSLLADTAANLVLVVPAGGTRWLDPVYWTLGIEARFYILVAVSCLFITPTADGVRRLAWTWLAVVLLVSVLPPGPWRSVVLAPHAPFFIAGMLTATADTHMRRCAALVALVACWWLGSTATLAAANPAGRSPLALSLGIAAILLAVPVVTWTRLSTLRSDALATLGLMTYPIYLFHVTPGRRLIGGLLDANVSPSLAYAVGAAMTLGLATATVHWEKVRSRVPWPRPS